MLALFGLGWYKQPGEAANLRSFGESVSHECDKKEAGGKNQNFDR